MTEFNDKIQRTAPLGPVRTGEEALVARLADRHSTPPRRLVAPAPDDAEIEAILQAALAAPAHGGLRHFRVIRIADSARPALCDLFEAAERELDPAASEEAVERAREKATHAPLLLLFVMRAYDGHPDIPLVEQHASAGAALGTILQGAFLLGYGAMAVSGHKLGTQVFRTAFALEPHETALCFVAIGTPAGPARTRHREAPSSILTVWPPASQEPISRDPASKDRTS